MKEQEEHTGKRVAVVGLGPVGSILAVHLQEAGCRVAICDTDKVKVNLIRKEGLSLEGAIQRKAVFEDIFTDLTDVAAFRPDYVMVAVKGYHAPAFVEEAVRRMPAGTIYISAQNGIGVEEVLTAGFGESDVLRLVINFAGNLKAPHTVKVSFFHPPNYLASMDDSREPAVRKIAGWLTVSGLETKSVSSFEILRRAWEKTILNSSLSALCGIGRLTIKEAMDMPDTVEIIEQVIEEAVEVAHAEKIRFDDDFIRNCLRYLRRAGDHFPSLAVDLINNRSTEIDFMNGKIVDFGRKHYIRTSLNLAFTNLVKAMTKKNASAFMKSLDASLVGKRLAGKNRDRVENGIVITGGDRQGAYYLGVDLGSAYTKFVVMDESENAVFRTALKTINRDKIGIGHVSRALRSEYNILASCATGYGRKRYADTDLARTEIQCAAEGLSVDSGGARNIVDIGGEDIKVILTTADGTVDHFYLNDKCAAGTGSFITEVAERAEIRIPDMSGLAAHSDTQKELNSFCTVFAKTEIMKWLMDGMSVENIARGIYLSIANRVLKLRIDPELPVWLVGGVIANHPYLKNVLEDRMGRSVHVAEHPQYVPALGAARIARRHHQRKQGRNEQVKEADLP